jgi:Trp operon repressor
MKTICKDEYMEKVGLLTEEETERLLSRMHGKLPRRLEKGKLSQQEALAIQMELEDEQLQEWREMVKILKKTAKKPEKDKGAEKASD